MHCCRMRTARFSGRLGEMSAQGVSAGGHPRGVHPLDPEADPPIASPDTHPCPLHAGIHILTPVNRMNDRQV